MKQRHKLAFKPKFKITSRMSKSDKSNKIQFVNEFLNGYAKDLIDYGYEKGYKKLARYILNHFRNMNLEFVDVALPEEGRNLPDSFMISHSPHTWSFRSRYNYAISCKFKPDYVKKLISFYNEFSQKVKRSRTIKVEPFEDLDPKDTSLLLAYEIFPHGTRIDSFIPRIGLYVETYFIKIWIYAEQDAPEIANTGGWLDFLYDPIEDQAKKTEHQAETTTIQITFITRKLGYRRGKNLRKKHTKNIERTLTKNFSAPEELSEFAEIFFDSWEFEHGKDGELILYYRIPSDKIWHLSINNILGLIDLTLKK